MANTGQQGTLYTVPNNTFYQKVSGENIVSIIDTTGDISLLQQNINQSRAANPDKFLSIQLIYKKNYSITTNSLTLSSNMALQGFGASIIADSAITASELIKISDGSSNVSINNLTLDDRQVILDSCIYGDTIGRCNIDGLTIFGGDVSIYLNGNGNYNNQITVTRCNISNSISESILIVSSIQPVCMDNICRDASSNGIHFINCNDGIIINNQLSSCNTGVNFFNCNRCSISNNNFDTNVDGIFINSGSSENKIISNNFSNCTNSGINGNGTSNVIYDNFFSGNANDYLVSGGINRIITTSTSLNATNQNYFYPPTITNRHASIIKNNTSRTNITVPDTTLSSVLTAYRNAKASNPSNVIVLNLTAPVITGNATIALSSNTCFVLSGSILLNSGVAAFSGKNISFISFSGGTIDGQNTTGRYGITLESCSYALIDQMTFNNFGDKNIRVSNSEPILLEGCLSPFAVGYCTINRSAARGIWIKGGAQSTSNLIFTNNTISNVNMDGIDFDVTSSGMIAKFNISNNNIRYGIFVEEGANLNQILANSCTGNEIGFNVYSNVISNTRYNSFIANKSISNQRGIRFGSFTSNKSTSGNFAFNNSIISCLTGINAQTYGSENYCSQNYFEGNTFNISDTSSAIFFNSPFLKPLIVARITSNGVYYTENYFDEITYTTNKVTSASVFSSEFDEVTLNNIGGGLGKRETNDGKVYVTGYFDEVTDIV